MARLLCALLLASLPVSGARIHVDPQPGKYFQTVLDGPAEGSEAGEFRGSIALDGSPSELAVAGRAQREESRLVVRARIAYADVPPAWADRFRPDGFEYRIRGRVADSAPVSWSGRLPWEAVVGGAGELALTGFLRLTSLELTAFSPKRSEGRAVLRAENPFAFPIRIAATSYELAANGHAIGRGATKGRILRPRRASGVELPFAVDHGEFLAAVGSAFVLGGEVETDLTGSLLLRFASGDVRVPLRLAARLSTSGARSGVFAPPPGSSDMSPRR